MRKRVGAAFAVTAGVLAALAGTSPASADVSAQEFWNGQCELGEVCFLQMEGQQALADVSPTPGIRDFSGTLYPGTNIRIKNTADRVFNNSSCDIAVYYGENLTGPADYIPRNSTYELVNTKNNNASFATTKC